MCVEDEEEYIKRRQKSEKIVGGVSDCVWRNEFFFLYFQFFIVGGVSDCVC